MTNDRWPESNRASLEALFLSDAYVNELGAKLVEWDGGRAVFRLAPEAHHRNFVGSVHGGALFSLADAALGVASNSWGRGPPSRRWCSAPAAGTWARTPGPRSGGPATDRPCQWPVNVGLRFSWKAVMPSP